MDYFKRRKNLLEKLEDNSILVLFAGEEIIRNADEMYNFTVNHSFYYFTGITQKNSILFLSKIAGVTHEELYLLKADPKEAKWIGDFLDHQKVKEIAQIDEIYPVEDFITNLNRLILHKNPQTIYLDMEHLRSDNYKDGKFRDYVSKNYLSLDIKNCYLVICSLRSIKEELEINCIKKALEITAEGLEAVRDSLATAKNENDIAALFEYTIRINGGKETSFGSIVGSGKNGTILHYNSNDAPLNDGDLLLIDCGAKYEHYSADITRTYPINGKFDARQKMIYEIVLKGQKMIISKVKPGISPIQLNDILREYYHKELKEIGLIKKPEDLDNYYWHGVSHYLGLDTHDLNVLKDQPLQEGNVITVEPGLYISEWNIGIRIEDNVLVCKEGCEVLSKAIEKEIEDIER